MKKKFLSVFILLNLFFLCFVYASSAQMMINPVRVELDVAPSSSVVDTITLYNTSDTELEIKAYWRDFTYKPPFSGKKEFFPIGTSEYSMGTWIRFSPQEFVLPPKGQQDVNYSIQIPSGIQGGYYGVMFFEQAPRILNKQMTGVSLVTRMGCLFFLESTDKNKSAEVENVQAQPAGISGEIVNLGNVFLFPKGIYYILDEEGLVADRGEVKKIYLIPERSAKFQVDIPEELASGRHTLVLTFDLKNGDSVIREVDFSKDNQSGLRILEIRN